MKILLIQPRSEGIGFTNLILCEPLGLEMVGGALHGHKVKILDLRFRNNLHSILSTFKPDLCGISCTYTIDYSSTVQLAQTIKHFLPRSFIVVGGHHASLNYQDFASHKEIDAVVIGEGEQTLRELVNCLEMNGDLSQIPGLALNQNGNQLLTPPRTFQKNLDDLPLPLREGAGRNLYHLGFQRPTALMETSRGCPYQCTFCGVWQFYQKSYRRKSAERVIEELKGIKEPFVLFTDDNFLMDVKRAEKIAQLIKNQKIKKTYTFQARSDTIVEYPEIMKLWKEVGLRKVFIGFEKVKDEELKTLHKNNLIENNDKALQILQTLGIEVWASFIIDPEYDHKDFKRLKDYILHRKIKTPTFSVLTPLPGTALFYQLKETLISKDFNLFDIAHAVLPTKLPLQEFYKEFCSLYRLPYSKYQLILEGFSAWFSHGFPLSHLLGMLRSAKRLSDPQSLLKAHGGSGRVDF
jgi:radical SAM superfamily enzyme YgiQ (UPF0313 family)